MIRKACLDDGLDIQKIINFYAKQGKMLARSLSEIYENIRDYSVAIEKGRLAGVVGLHVNWEDLAEVKSLAIKKNYQGRGLGEQLVQVALKEGRELGIKRFYTLTYIPLFFKPLGFKIITRDKLPHKVWSECVKCPKFPDCDEIAMLREDYRAVRKKKKKKSS